MKNYFLWLLMQVHFFVRGIPLPNDEVTTITLTHDLDELPAEMDKIENQIALRIDTIKSGFDCKAFKVSLRGVVST